ncbi:hypothetical protein EV659_102316 [Rhodothalassium salexigens DSM 2132]|uniref:Lipoprotein n=1 Tax=Rhodothalassium salexigens DSM 2132 TaxID=1188247 RepID=A0A4R2PQE2_RHOSA|nr:hypothetical protein [Rhodothalassium salexigens]MBB4210536.1 hypothetical protein [Rhodothalassium salexigens DSM 2132]MBK1638055.1 hypothetical protein [Rhodothalassium salexigens DSM 2132]TCP37907.1 hypothetical protein EV659_102316 [Rhodothalassium salexigens DSM 2132]
MTDATRSRLRALFVLVPLALSAGGCALAAGATAGAVTADEANESDSPDPLEDVIEYDEDAPEAGEG